MFNHSRRQLGRTLSGWLVAALMALAVMLLVDAGQARARGFPNARWKAEEQRCIAACPPVSAFFRY